MQERIAQSLVYKTQPAIAKSLIDLSNAASLHFDKKLVHLVKTRASQINGCAFCLNMHLTQARADGETQDRLDLLTAWHEVPYFSDRERAALAWTEAVTRLADRGVSDSEFSIVSAQFSDEEIIHLTALIVSINGWNRIAASLHFIPQLAA